MLIVFLVVAIVQPLMRLCVVIRRSRSRRAATTLVLPVVTRGVVQPSSHALKEYVEPMTLQIVAVRMMTVLHTLVPRARLQIVARLRLCALKRNADLRIQQDAASRILAMVALEITLCIKETAMVILNVNLTMRLMQCGAAAIPQNLVGNKKMDVPFGEDLSHRTMGGRVSIRRVSLMHSSYVSLKVEDYALKRKSSPDARGALDVAMMLEKYGQQMLAGLATGRLEEARQAEL